MANEISVTASVKAVRGNFTLDSNVGAQRYDMATGSGGTPGVVSVTTTAAAVSFGAVTPGIVWIRNLSTGNKVSFETTAGQEFARLPAGMINIIRKGTGGWKVSATTAGGTALIDIRSYSS